LLESEGDNLVLSRKRAGRLPMIEDLRNTRGGEGRLKEGGKERRRLKKVRRRPRW